MEIACAEALGRLDEEPEAEEQTDDRGDKRPPNQRKRSTTDPDATMARQGSGKSEPTYKNHRVVDDKAGVITALKTTTGMVNEAHELPALTQQHEGNTGCKARVAVADCKYGGPQRTLWLFRRRRSGLTLGIFEAGRITPASKASSTIRSLGTTSKPTPIFAPRTKGFIGGT